MTALFDIWPALRAQTPWVSLGAWPTPVEAAARVVTEAALPGELWLKRDDLSSIVYGGNKVRLLEHLLGDALQRGATRVYSSGAVGSNFALATALHAPRLGLTPGAICFPQPLSADAERSHRIVVQKSDVIEIPHWSLLPLASERVRRAAEQRGERALVLSQVTFAPEALLGYVAAGLELARQVARGECAEPVRIVLPIGSAATSAGILAGLSLARALGVWQGAPTLSLVRIAAWPLSRRGRVLSLAQKVLRALASLANNPALELGSQQLLPVDLVTDQLGAGYARPTPAGSAAKALFASAGYPILDETYSAKAAAHALERLGAGDGRVLLWCTKSSAASVEPGSGPAVD